jgi:predicted GH43/DUF377 family glycosyl hydrolase
MLPTPVQRPDGGIRLLVGCADENTVGRIGWIDLAADDPTRVIAEAQSPVFDIGRPGMFDDNGVVPLCTVRVDDELRFYYSGFQLQRKVPYTIFSGLAYGDSDASAFRRVAENPILDRSAAELFFRAAPFVMRVGTGWRMWYIGGSDWTESEGKILPVYSLCHAESEDGIHWPPSGQVCFKPEQPSEIGFGRPWVMRDADGFRMWYSIRRVNGYRLGYATSSDGLSWTRRDTEVGIAPSTEGWDSEMICYACVLPVGGDMVMFYNGNGYGRSGVGGAILEHG